MVTLTLLPHDCFTVQLCLPTALLPRYADSPSCSAVSPSSRALHRASSPRSIDADPFFRGPPRSDARASLHTAGTTHFVQTYTACDEFDYADLPASLASARPRCAGIGTVFGTCTRHFVAFRIGNLPSRWVGGSPPTGYRCTEATGGVVALALSTVATARNRRSPQRRRAAA